MIDDSCILDRILPFLSNQSLTKLQAITGSHFATCEPNLARFCSPCENDIPRIFQGRCNDCATANGYKPMISATQART